ncbi:putative exported protein [Enhygromyxa salina]|uniref:Putative exported protein n=1 Tax=Enhygromyxa salina TaxID=215803 RepID=A0A0C2CZ53_9BACT|nr:translocation/assembly module TamB [Enhygromyxa salina]KIG16216.1 putative exported protein [Enhygromyxa salina]
MSEADEPSPTPGELPDALPDAPPDTPPSKRRRWWRWLVRPIVGLIGLVALAILIVAWVPAASQGVARFALERWDAGIPGEVEWQGMSGSLGAGLELQGFELRDGDGRELVRASSVLLDLQMADLLRLEAGLERVQLHELEVWVDHDWGALAAPSEAPAEPSEGLGPNLPIRIRAALELTDTKIYLADQLLVSNELLTLQITGMQRSARAKLELVGTALPQQDLRVEGLTLALAWAEPEVTLEQLEIQTELGRLHTLESATANLAASTGEVGLQLEANVDSLADRLGLEQLRGLDEAVVRVHGELRDDPAAQAQLIVVAALGRGNTLALIAKASTPAPDARRVDLHLDATLAAAQLHPEQGPLALVLDAGLEQDAEGALAATLELRANDSRSGAALELDAGGDATSLSPPRGSAWLELRGPALEGKAAVASSDARALDASWSFVIPDLGAPLELLAPYLDQPQLAAVRGSLELTGSCASELGQDLATTRCPIALGVERVAGFDTQLGKATLTGAVSPFADPVAFDAQLGIESLRHAAVSLDQAQLTAAGTPERITVAGRGQGMRERFEIDASLSLAGPDKQIDLAKLMLVTSRGTAPVELTLARPTRITISPERIAVRDLQAYAVGGLIAAHGHVGLADQASDLHVELLGVDLARVDAVVPGPRLRGRINLEATLRGRLDHPSGWARLRADTLEIDDNRIGEVELAANLCGAAGLERTLAAELASVGQCTSPGELLARLRVAGPLAKTVELDARVPLRFGEQVGLRPGRPLAARLLVREFNLLEIGGMMPPTPSWWRQIPPDASAPPGDPRLIPTGLVDVELTLSGTSTRPRAQLIASARDITIDRTKLGTVVIGSSLGDAGLLLDLDAELPMAKLGLDLEIPVWLNLTRPGLKWKREAEHAVTVSLVDLDLDALEQTLGPKLPALASALAQADLGGRVSASIQGRGPATGPTKATQEVPWLVASVNASELTHAEDPLGDASVGVELRAGLATGSFALDGPLARRLDARFELPIHVALGPEPSFELDADARIDAEIHVHEVELDRLEPHIGALALAGRADLDVLVRGTLADPKLELAARLADLQLQAERVGDLTLLAVVDHERARVETDLVRRGDQLITAKLEVPLIVALTNLDDIRVGWDQHGDHRVSARGRGLDRELVTALLGPGATEKDFNAALRFDVDGGGTLSQFALTAALDGQVSTTSEPSLGIHGALVLDERHQGLALELRPSVDERLTLSAGLDADVAALMAGDQVIGEVPFTLDLDAPALALELFGPFVAPSLHDPTGTLSAQLTGRGVVATPQLSGTVELHDAAVTVIPLRQRLQDIAVAIDFDNQSVDLRTLSVGAGRGEVTGSGRASLDAANAGVQANLEIQISEFPIVRPGLPAMTIDSDVEIDVALTPAKTRVLVALARSEVKVASGTGEAPKSVPSTADIVFVSAADAQASAPTQTEPETTVAAVGSELDLRLELRDPLRISGSAIDMAWGGSLGITRRAALEIDGQLEARRGRLELLGHRFELRRGLVNLPTDGSLDPFLDIIAETTTTEADVTVTIRGRASAPELHFSSSPALSEYQILTLLVTGSTELGQGEGEVQAKAASLLAAVSSPKLQEKLDRYLGIDRANIGFGDSIDQPILSVGKRVSPKVWVETTYHHNAPDNENTAEVGVEYDFARRWSLETYFGDAAVGGVGVYWTHSFGAVPWRPRPTPPEPVD